MRDPSMYNPPPLSSLNSWRDGQAKRRSGRNLVKKAEVLQAEEPLEIKGAGLASGYGSSRRSSSTASLRARPRPATAMGSRASCIGSYQSTARPATSSGLRKPSTGPLDPRFMTCGAIRAEFRGRGMHYVRAVDPASADAVRADRAEEFLRRYRAKAKGPAATNQERDDAGMWEASSKRASTADSSRSNMHGKRVGKLYQEPEGRPSTAPKRLTSASSSVKSKGSMPEVRGGCGDAGDARPLQGKVAAEVAAIRCSLAVIDKKLGRIDRQLALRKLRADRSKTPPVGSQPCGVVMRTRPEEVVISISARDYLRQWV
ncbi:unnamed protein product [Chrysoparadoxa australica]